MPIKKFYMRKHPDYQVDGTIYTTYQQAREAAEAYARQYPGKDIYLLEAIKVVRTTKPDVEWATISDTD